MINNEQSYETIYQVLTPAGAFDVAFGDDESPYTEYRGNDTAIQFFKNYLVINQVSGEHGHLLIADNLEPDDLYGFCQPTGSGISVLPPFDDLLAYAQEEAINDQESMKVDHALEVKDRETWREIMSIPAGEKVKTAYSKRLEALKNRRDQDGNESMAQFFHRTLKQALGQDQESGASTLDNTTQEFDNVATVTGIEKLKLAKELGGIRGSIKTVTSGIEKLKLVKRIGEIRVILGGSVKPVQDDQPVTQADATKAIKYLGDFIGRSQLNAIATAMRGEEKQFFFDKMVSIEKQIKAMPETYGQDGMGDKAIAYLHYFKGSGDWYITEKDSVEGEPQHQAFGLANLGHGGEMGYISIDELIKSGVELDMYWTPKTIGAIKGKDDDIEPKTENAPVPIPADSDETATQEGEGAATADTETEKQVPATGNTELDKQRAKLQGLIALQERMKSANKVVKNKKLTDEQKIEQLKAQGFSDAQASELLKPDFVGRTGFADYQLTNNNATIRNTQKRIEQLEAQELAAAKASSGDSATSYDFDGGTIDLDYGDDRIRVNFDSKPDSDMIAKLKQNGFKWSPTNMAWQRQLTDNAIYAVNRLFGTKIKTAAQDMEDEKNKPVEKGVVTPVVHETTESQGNPLVAAFETELNSLKLETDIVAYNNRLDDIYARIEKAGLAQEMDGILNDAADVLTGLLAEAEKKSG
jgi:hypothetical protein